MTTTPTQHIRHWAYVIPPTRNSLLDPVRNSNVAEAAFKKYFCLHGTMRIERISLCAI